MTCHPRACPGSTSLTRAQPWMAGTSPAMTARFGLIRDERTKSRLLTSTAVIALPSGGTLRQRLLSNRRDEGRVNGRHRTSPRRAAGAFAPRCDPRGAGGCGGTGRGGRGTARCRARPPRHAQRDAGAGVRRSAGRACRPVRPRPDARRDAAPVRRHGGAHRHGPRPPHLPFPAGQPLRPPRAGGERQSDRHRRCGDALRRPPPHRPRAGADLLRQRGRRARPAAHAEKGRPPAAAGRRGGAAGRAGKPRRHHPGVPRRPRRRHRAAARARSGLQRAVQRAPTSGGAVNIRTVRSATPVSPRAKPCASMVQRQPCGPSPVRSMR